MSTWLSQTSSSPLVPKPVGRDATFEAAIRLATILKCRFFFSFRFLHIFLMHFLLVKNNLAATKGIGVANSIQIGIVDKRSDSGEPTVKRTIARAKMEFFVAHSALIAFLSFTSVFQKFI